jgi:aspartate/methionine/tyrosine aminotransferase
MVTAGANQAFVNIVLSLVDEGDRVVLFTPYYFNHIMALQMTGGAEKVGERFISLYESSQTSLELMTLWA